MRKEATQTSKRPSIGSLSAPRLFISLMFALVVGVVGAAASIVLSLVVDFAESLSVQFSWLVLLLPVCGVVSVLLYRLLKLPEHLASDTLIERLRSNDPIPAALAPGILAGTFLSVLGGASVGKEAAALQMGASLGALVGRPFRRLSARYEGGHFTRGCTAACGMASCFGALFFAPLGSVMFVLELARFDRSLVRQTPTLLIGAFVAFFLARAVGIGDILPRVMVPTPSWNVFAACVLVGLVSAVVGMAFAALLKGARHIVRTRVGHPLIAVVAGGTLFVGVVLVFGLQSFEGTGMTLLRAALAGHAHPADFAFKAGLTVLVLAACFKGGEIMPLFTIGALLGCVVGPAVGAPAGFSAMVGLVALFAAATRCPLAAVLMGIEIFGLDAAIYLVVCVAVAFMGSWDVGVFGRGARRWRAQS